MQTIFGLPKEVLVQCLRSPEALFKFSHTSSKVKDDYHTYPMYFDSIKLEQRDGDDIYGEASSGKRFHKSIDSLIHRSQNKAAISPILEAYAKYARKALIPSEYYRAISLEMLAPLLEGKAREETIKSITPEEFSDDMRQSRILQQFCRPDMSTNDWNLLMESSNFIKTSYSKGAFLEKLAENARSSHQLEAIVDNANGTLSFDHLTYVLSEVISSAHSNKTLRLRCITLCKNHETLNNNVPEESDGPLSEFLVRLSPNADSQERKEAVLLSRKIVGERNLHLALRALIPGSDAEDLQEITERAVTITDEEWRSSVLLDIEKELGLEKK